ncbi:hypothetical protein RQP46_005159 [Phenoliferia psychrophenolica]
MTTLYIGKGAAYGKDEIQSLFDAVKKQWGNSGHGVPSPTRDPVGWQEVGKLFPQRNVRPTEGGGGGEAGSAFADYVDVERGPSKGKGMNSNQDAVNVDPEDLSTLSLLLDVAATLIEPPEPVPPRLVSLALTSTRFDVVIGPLELSLARGDLTGRLVPLGATGMSDLPPPLALPRIHRLLRPLRSSLGSLLTSLALAEARLLPSRDPTNKGKGKARPRELDLDYGSRKSLPSSSPFQSTQQRRAKRHKTNATYGSKRVVPLASKVQSAETRTATRREELAPVELRKCGLDEEAVAKVGHLVKAFRNVLECAYGVDRRASGGEDVVKRDKVPTLVELMARRVGSDVEEAVGGDPEGSETEMSTFEEEEDVTRLVEEWYEAVPPYARGWMLGHHATAIVLRGLEDVSAPILLSLLEVCTSVNAIHEAALFYYPLLSLSITSPPFLPPQASHILPLSLLSHRPYTTFFSSLSHTLLESTFADRLFYADFLDLSRTPLFIEDGPLVAQLLTIVIEVGVEMITAIEAAAEADEDDEDGGETLVAEVVRRLEGQVRRALPVLLRLGAEEDSAAFDLSIALESLISTFPCTAESLSPLLIPFLLALSQTSPSSLSLLATHLSLPSPSPSAPPITHIPALLETLSTQSLLALSVLLHSSPHPALHALERTLLLSAIESYDDLVDVRSTKGLEVFTKDTFQQLLLQRRGSVPTQSPSPSSPPRPAVPSPSRAKPSPLKWTLSGRTSSTSKPLLQSDPFEPSADPHTPARPTTSPSALAHSSLGRPFRLARSHAVLTPSRALLKSKARKARQATNYAEPEDEESDASDPEQDGEEIPLENGDLSDPEEEEGEGEPSDLPTPRPPPAAKQTDVIDLSLDDDTEDDEEDVFRVRTLATPIIASEADDLNLLATAPPSRPLPTSKRPGTGSSGRARSFVKKKKMVESSEDELAM